MFKWPDGKIYKGTFDGDNNSGYGQMIMGNSKIYGSWKNQSHYS